MSELKTRAKYGYLSYNDMLTRISEGILDEYDIVFTTDTKECYVITPELEPSPIRSKVYVYDSIIEAESALNNNIDTYIGQIVSVWYKGAYRGFSVNRTNNVYTLTPLSEITEVIDYNTLGNKPIENIIGTLENPIVLSKLDAGVYSIKGQYQISEFEENIFLAASYVLVIVERDSQAVYVKKITSTEIIDYTVQNNSIISTSVVTKEFLIEQGYATEKYVDEKIAMLDYLTKEDAKNYIEELIETTLSEKIEVIVEQKIDEKILPTQREEITDLFF